MFVEFYSQDLNLQSLNGFHDYWTYQSQHWGNTWKTLNLQKNICTCYTAAITKESSIIFASQWYWVSFAPYASLADGILANQGPRLKKISCSTQLSMNFFLLINVKMPTIVGILTFMSPKNSILGLSEPKKAKFLDILYLCAFKISCSIELSMKNVL